MIIKFNEFKLFEKLGINDNVKILSKYIFNNLCNMGINIGDNIIFDIFPSNIEIKINKLYVNITETESCFELSKTKMTKNGYIFYIKIPKYSEETNMIHEINHIYQYYKKI